MSKAAEHKGLRVIEKGKARRGKLKKTRTKNTRFGIAAVHRQAGTNMSTAEVPAQTSAKKTAATRKTVPASPPLTEPVLPHTTESEDQQSLSWMAARAVSALDAVKATQVKKAEALFAQAEEQGLDNQADAGSAADEQSATPEASRTESGEQKEAPATAVKQPADEISAPEVTPEPVTDKATPATAGEASSNLPVEPVAVTDPSPLPPPRPVADEKTEIHPAPAALVAKRGNHFSRHPLMASAVIAVIGLFGYRYWFSGQGTEEQTLVTRTAAPVSTAAETATSPTASTPAVALVPDRTVSAEPTSPAAPVHIPEFRPTPPPAEPAQYREDVIAAVPEEEAPAIAATTAPPVPALPATQPAARTPGYGYYPQQQPWQQPYYPTANPRYRYR